MIKKYSIIFSLMAVMMLLLAGCRTLKPPTDENTQPWAQPEKWQGSPSIPGLTQNQD
ncbi:MAG: hypothetical protein JW774_01405 [Candidatus Aureabacteria bacterium]|nr:hypothetical protein [Candidatus Auribacterota bacterium]